MIHIRWPEGVVGQVINVFGSKARFACRHLNRNTWERFFGYNRWQDVRDSRGLSETCVLHLMVDGGCGGVSIAPPPAARCLHGDRDTVVGDHSRTPSPRQAQTNIDSD
ncbi:hypothetical protein Zmor_013221 [Zophobas morio]|uniref:Uncharacterized protein n=1 Tax=Zophobas morio TaxID=2755281 RepID=A0AA38MFB4_9CUCU|nr:hypothetical protein Zmor_013221 [Zophobas morio]